MELDKPVVMGCSIGGRIVLNLAIAHAAEFRALIALEAADFQQPWYDTAWLHRPDVHGGEVLRRAASGLIAPQSPPVSRHETLWMYMQGGPGVFKGDLYFYRVDGDLREKVKSIDTKVCPLYLLTGEYDFSCTSEDTPHGGADPGRRGADHEARRPLPDERASGEVPRIHPAGAEEDFLSTCRTAGLQAHSCHRLSGAKDLMPEQHEVPSLRSGRPGHERASRPAVRQEGYSTWNTSYTGPVGSRRPVATETMRLRNRYFSDAVSNHGVVRK